MRKRSPHVVPTVLSLIAVVVICFIQIADDGPILDVRERLESTLYDLRLRALLPERAAPDPRVVIVDIDERSLRDEGHWPWPRSTLARLVTLLRSYGTAAIGFDVVFAEAESNPAVETARALTRPGVMQHDGLVEEITRIAELIDPDREFTEAIAAGGVVLGYTFAAETDIRVGALPSPALQLPAAQPYELPFVERTSYIGNLERLQSAAESGGFFSLQADDDGIIRRAPLLMRYGDNIYAALSLELARVYLGMPPLDLVLGETNSRPVLEAVSLGGMLSLPTDDSGRVLVPFRGGARSYRYVSASDVLEDRADPGLFRDALVLVGTSAAGLVDLRAVPVQSVFPGVEVHANIISSILDGGFPHEPDWVAGLNIGVLLALGLLASVLFPRMNASGMLVATIVLAGAYTGVWLWIWDRHAINIAAALPVLMVIGLSSLNMTWGFVTERRARQRLKDRFGQYVPRAVVEQIAENEERETTFEGETREITVLFADIRGFTPLSERMNANELKRMLNFYLTEMTSIVFDKRGTIDKYVGDMIMAFWGAPLADTNQRNHALDAALTMLERLEALQPDLKARGWPEIHVGIGLNTGNMNVGDMGSVYRRCYTVVGDAVNLGSRLEGLSKYYGVRVIASEATRQGQEDFFFRKLDVVRVKGKDKAVTIYEPLCRTIDADARLRSEIRTYHDALEAYFRRDWEEASRMFDGLAGQFPEAKLYSLYRDRVTRLAASAPGIDWDGVFSHSLKWE